MAYIEGTLVLGTILQRFAFRICTGWTLRHYGESPPVGPVAYASSRDSRFNEAPIALHAAHGRPVSVASAISSATPRIACDIPSGAARGTWLGSPT